MENAETKVIFAFLLGFGIRVVFEAIMAALISWMSSDDKPDWNKIDLGLQIQLIEIRALQAELREGIKTLSKMMPGTGEQPESKDQEDT